MPGQGRLGDRASISSDAHGCPGCPHPGLGPGISGSSNVLVNKRPAMRVGDRGMHAACCGPNQWIAQKGSSTVFVNGLAAFRQNDPTVHCGGLGKLIESSNDVIVGDGGGDGAARGSSDEATDSAQQSDGGDAVAAAQGANNLKTFVDLELIDLDDRAVGLARFNLKTPDGQTITGLLDSDGKAHIDQIPKGQCEVSFPDLHATEWRKI